MLYGSEVKARIERGRGEVWRGFVGVWSEFFDVVEI